MLACGAPLHQLHMTGRLARKETYHGERVGIGGSLRIPLHHDLPRGTGVGAVVAGQTGLVRAHGPTGVHRIGSDGNQANIGWELALSTLLLQSDILRASFVVVTGMVVAVASGINAREEGDEGGSPGRRDVELHCGISKE